MAAFRDDHDAALARADALESELERNRAELAERDRKVAELEAKLARRGKSEQRPERPELQGNDVEPADVAPADVAPALRSKSGDGVGGTSDSNAPATARETLALLLGILFCIVVVGAMFYGLATCRPE